MNRAIIPKLKFSGSQSDDIEQSIAKNEIIQMREEYFRILIDQEFND